MSGLQPLMEGRLSVSLERTIACDQSMNGSLRFVYTVVREIIGVAAPEEGDAVVIDDAGSGTWVCLTRDASRHRADIDEGAAVATMLLRGIAGGGPQGSFAERLAHETSAIADERSSKGEPRHYLVLRLTGEVSDWDARTEREVDEFVIRLNGAPKFGIRERASVELASVVIAMSQCLGRPVQLVRHAEGLVFFRQDGKKVHAMEMTGFPPTLYLSGAWDPSQQPAIQAEFSAIRGLTSLSRVHELFAASLDGAKDRLRAFQAGWSALEIFVNKVFSRYERDFLGGLTSDSDPNAKEWFVARIHEVMRDKYRLRDRFALIAGVLASSDADADVAEFISAKTKRDDLAHGKDVPDSDLPLETVHRILGKYLHLHATNTSR